MKKPADDPLAWLEKADADLRLAELGYESGEALEDLICYHAHQSAEKCLNGFLVAMRADFRYVHDLEYLNNRCRESDPGFAELGEPAAYLNAFARTTRYPGEEASEVTRDQAEHALLHAKAIRRLVHQKLQP